MKLKIINTLDTNNFPNNKETNLSIKCPYCEAYSRTPFVSENAYISSSLPYKPFTICLCGKCEKLFFCILNTECTTVSQYRTYPNTKFRHTFPKEIETISPDFVNIYTQAIEAQNLGLDELVGNGLRKSVEYLITDYITKVLEETPKDTFHNKINQIDIKNATTHATLIRWIGNDSTHPTPHHPNLTIELMIKCIDSLVYYLCQEYITRTCQDLLDSEISSTSN